MHFRDMGVHQRACHFSNMTKASLWLKNFREAHEEHKEVQEVVPRCSQKTWICWWCLPFSENPRGIYGEYVLVLLVVPSTNPRRHNGGLCFKKWLPVIGDVPTCFLTGCSAVFTWESDGTLRFSWFGRFYVLSHSQNHEIHICIYIYIYMYV